MKVKAAKKGIQNNTSKPDSIELLNGALTEEPSLGNTLNLLVALQNSGVLRIESAPKEIDLLNQHFGAEVRPLKGRQSNTQKINEKKLDYLLSATRSYLGKQGGPLKSMSKADKLKWTDKVRAKFAKIPKNQILEELVTLAFELECLKQDLAAITEEKSYLSKLFIETLSGRQQTVSAQTKKKDQKFAPNNACMQTCLDEVLNAGASDKQLSKRTYTKFCRLVKKKYPSPPVLQKARLSKDEKMQSAEDQKADREALARNEWAPTTLRTYFEKALKVHIKDLPK